MEWQKKKEQKQEPQMGIGLETLPSCVLITTILPKLDLETLCSFACVRRAMNTSVSQALPSFSSLNLSIRKAKVANWGKEERLQDWMPKAERLVGIWVEFA
ncbi:hypothetical protein RchiOBHm_Chr3g0493531 [Rosa chinensis]|uniref:F-box domain-containing protein n=1 Tax=Rosa chinensis TaxID=74649 RepID=A0A2P6RGS5_ROSCH|nr:hypothetical protein RchiOBHm_Chr3g0493531 [Rosa chinensis]